MAKRSIKNTPDFVAPTAEQLAHAKWVLACCTLVDFVNQERELIAESPEDLSDGDLVAEQLADNQFENDRDYAQDIAADNYQELMYVMATPSAKALLKQVNAERRAVLASRPKSKKGG